jgi:hypothetical protein
MAYDSARIVVADSSLLETSARTAVAPDFDRAERIALLLGGAGLGAMAGFGLAMSLGYLSILNIGLIAAPLLLLALHLTSRTLTEAISLRAFGCATATALHGAALIGWPMAALLSPISPLAFWMAPVVAGSALIMFASCWQGPQRAVYRLSLQAVLVGAVTAHQGLMFVMGA